MSDCFADIHKHCIKRRSPRPWRRNFGEVWVLGLVECDSRPCKAECGDKTKKWNRDLLAVLNFRRIWNAYIHGRERLDDLRPRRRENGDNPGDGDGNVQNDNVQNGNTGAMEVVQNNIVQAGFVMYRGV